MLNKIQIIGRLGRDPEVRYLPSGEAVANLSVAVSEKWRDKSSGEMKEHTEWLSCSVFGKSGENAAQYLKKGRLCYVEGKLQTRTYEKDGQQRKVVDIKVTDWKALEYDKPANDGPPAEGDHLRKPRQSAPVDDQYFDDGIPF